MKPLKLAHNSDGHTEVVYDDTGNFILTSGADGKVCIWEGPEDTDTVTVNIGSPIRSLLFQGGRFFTSSENQVRIFSFPDGVSDGIVTRFTSPSGHVCCSEDGNLVVAGSDEFTVKVISMEDKECVSMYKQHQAPILSTALDPTGEFVASASCDGTVQIWNIADAASEKTLDVLNRCNDVSQAKSLCRMCWSVDGEFLLVPVEAEVHVYLRSSWEVVHKLGSAQITGVINVVALSRDGKHLAIGCTNGELGIYDWQEKRLLEKHCHPKQLKVTAVAWNPSNIHELVFCDNMGQMGVIDNALATVKETKIEESNGTGDLFADGDDDALISASGHPTADSNGFGDEDENSVDIGSIKRSFNLGLDDDEDAESVTSIRADLASAAIPAPVVPLPANIFKPTPLQPAFQPCSTPEHISNRFMIYNSVGSIRHYVSEFDNTIDVEFHDATTYHALHIDNKSEFVMADLSSQAVLLASRGDESTPSKVTCMHFGSWDTNKEWSFNMPEEEEIKAITVADTWVAVATDIRLVRIFSIGGVQRQVFSLPGQVVALASHKDKLAAVYHQGMGVPGEQNMGISVMKVTGRRCRNLLQGEQLPLSPKSRLSWLGFSDEGSPFYMDVDGIVRMLDRSFGPTWCPVANTKQHVKGKSDHYFIVGVNERQQQIRCIPCKGARYPPVLPRPALAVLSFQLPLCEMDSEKSQYEELLQRSQLFAQDLLSVTPRAEQDELRDEVLKPVREALVKLFALSAKSETDFRALEICEMMEEQNLLQVAVTYASRLKRMQLAERVNQIMKRRQEEMEEQQEEEESEAVSDIEDDRQAKEEDIECEMEVAEERIERQHASPMLLLNTRSEKDVKYKDILPVRKNPFKIGASADRITTKGSQVFDNMQKPSPKPQSIIAPLPVSIRKSGKKSGQQGKLTGFKKGEQMLMTSPTQVKKEKLSQDPMEEKSENQPGKKKVSAFDLWYESSKESLIEEYPDLSEEDQSQKAAEAFRELSKEERQTWVHKAKELAGPKKRKLSGDSTLRKDSLEEKKIKADDNDSAKKMPLSQSTNAKLAKFAKTD